MLKAVQKNKGFTLIEILIVIGIIAVMTIGIFIAYTKVQAGSQANNESRNVSTIVAGIRNLYASQGNYNDGAMLTTVIKGNIIPESMLNTGNPSTATAINNSFGGTVTLTPANLGTGTNNAFDVKYDNVPASVCSKFVTESVGVAQKIQVAGTSVKDSTTGNPNLNVPALTTQCNSTGSPVVVDFISF